MKYRFLLYSSFIMVLGTCLSVVSCGKDDPDVTGPGDDCAASGFAVTASATNTQGCGSLGTITASSTGGTGTVTYKLNANGTYQSSAVFSNIAAGNYTVFAKNGNGCEKSTTVTVNSNNTEGPLFTQVKQLLAARCVSCHNTSTQSGGKDWTVSCNIVNNKARINQRAVVEGTMPAGGPPLTQAEKDLIINWLTAGGDLND